MTSVHSPRRARRILILPAGYGEGHNAAARSVAAACDELAGPGTARVADIFALASPWLNSIVRRTYLFAINRTPRIWSRAYTWMNRSELLPLSFRLARARSQAAGDDHRGGKTGRDLQHLSGLCLPSRKAPARGPDEPAALQRRDRFDQHQFAVVARRRRGWFVPNQDSVAIVRQAGIDPERLHVLGFPVNLFFSRHAAEFFPPELGPGVRPRILFIINTGTRQAEAVAHRLLGVPDWEITCAVGRNQALRRRLEQTASKRLRPAEILGWTDQIPRLLMTHHVVISKAGGATTQEAIAALCPMIVNQVVPGQEEGNYELLRRHGAGTRAETPAAIEAALRQAFADGGAVWRQWRRALAELSRPEAARDIAARLLAAARETRPAPAGAAPICRP